MKKLTTFVLGILAVLFCLELLLTTLSFFSKIERDNKDDERQEKRIFCIGDSFTYGAGVPADKSFPYQLGEMLKEDDFEVLNFGILGANTRIALNKLEKEIKKRGAPDIVTLMTGEANTWNFDGYRSKKSTFSRKIYKFLNRFRTVRLFTLLKKYFEEKRSGVEKLYGFTPAEEKEVYLNDMNVINRLRYDRLYEKLLERKEKTVKKGKIPSFDEVFNRKGKTAELYYDIYLNDIYAIPDISLEELEKLSYQSIIAYTIKALYVKDINSVFKNVEFIVKKGELTKELYSIASFLFTEKDRQKELIDRNKLTSKISGSLYDNILPLDDNLLTRFDNFDDPFSFRQYIMDYCDEYSADIRIKDKAFRDTFFIGLYNMVIRNCFSNDQYVKKIVNSLDELADVDLSFHYEYIEIIERLLSNIHFRERIFEKDLDHIFSLYERLKKEKSKKEPDDLSLLMSRIEFYRYLNTAEKKYLENSFERFINCKLKDKNYFYLGVSIGDEYKDGFYEVLSDIDLFKSMEDKRLLRDMVLNYMEIAEALAIDYEYDRSIEMFEKAFIAAKSSDMNSWEKAWILIRKNVFEEKADKKDIDYLKTVKYILKALEQDPDDELKRSYLAETISKLDAGLIPEKAIGYIEEFDDLINPYKEDDMYKNVRYWIKHDIERIISICRENNIRLITIGYPHFDNYLLKEISKKHDLVYLDLYNYFQPLYKKYGIRKYLLGDTHLTVKGNEEVAKLLRNVIK